ncbi:MAG: ATP-binding protein [Anaerolineae bacterium]
MHAGEPIPLSTNSLSNLRAESLAPIALPVGAVGALWFWLVLWPGVFPQTPLAAWFGSAILLLAPIASFSLRERYPRLAAPILVLGILAAIACGSLAYHAPHFAYLYAVAILFSSVLLGRRGSLVTAGLAGSLTVLTATFAGDQDSAVGETFLVLSVLAMVTLASLLLAQNLYTALLWFEHSYHLAREHEAAALERRAELRRARDALETTTERLQRTNQELSIARQEAEQERAMKEQFVANVSHELRTPLNLVVGFAEMMYLSPESYDGVTWSRDLVSDLGEMYRAARHLEGLVSDVLDLSRIDAHRLPMLREWVDVGDLIREVVETTMPLFRQRKLYCRVEYAESVPRLLVDRLRLRQVLINLLNNAARFTDKGGITVHSTLAEDSLVVSVQDTGVGIPEEQLESIFAKFTQAHSQVRRGGAGLGLAISRELVELHGGRMWAASKVGEGSVFSFSLPLPGAMPQAVPLQHLPAQPVYNPNRAPIIVVDPDPEVGTWLQRYLDERPILTVSTAQDAEEIVETQHPAAIIINQPPDAPAQSWFEPLGPQSDRCNLPVLRCSVPSSDWVVRAKGVDDFVMKPVSRASIARVLERLCPEGGRILVADDNPGFVALVSRMLSGMSRVGRVWGAHSGGEALRLARLYTPDLMLVDVMMPDMTAFEMLDILRKEDGLKGIRVVMVTATSYAEEILRNYRGRFTLCQSHSLVARPLVELIDTALSLFRPDYPSESTESNA